MKSRKPIDKKPKRKSIAPGHVDVVGVYRRRGPEVKIIEGTHNVAICTSCEARALADWLLRWADWKDSQP